MRIDHVNWIFTSAAQIAGYDLKFLPRGVFRHDYPLWSAPQPGRYAKPAAACAIGARQHACGTADAGAADHPALPATAARVAIEFVRLIGLMRFGVEREISVKRDMGD